LPTCLQKSLYAYVTGKPNKRCNNKKKQTKKRNSKSSVLLHKMTNFQLVNKFSVLCKRQYFSSDYNLSGPLVINSHQIHILLSTIHFNSILILANSPTLFLLSGFNKLNFSRSYHFSPCVLHRPTISTSFTSSPYSCKSWNYASPLYVPSVVPFGITIPPFCCSGMQGITTTSNNKLHTHYYFALPTNANSRLHTKCEITDHLLSPVRNCLKENREIHFFTKILLLNVSLFQ